MPILLLLAIIAVPLVEIAVFIQVGEAIGLMATLVAVVLGTMVGVAVVKQQGLAVLTRAQQQMDAGIVPDRELFDGVCLVIAGFLILLPGFVTDTLGVLLLLPPIRDLLRSGTGRFVKVRRDGTPRRPSPGGGVIEGEFEEVDENAPRGEGPHDSDPRSLP